jgi:hypothetical protein
MARRGNRPGRVLPPPRSLRARAPGRRPRPPRDDARARGVRRLPSSSPFPRRYADHRLRPTQWTLGAVLPSGSAPGHPPVGMNSAPAVRTASAQIPTHTCRGGHSGPHPSRASGTTAVTSGRPTPQLSSPLRSASQVVSSLRFSLARRRPSATVRLRALCQPPQGHQAARACLDSCLPGLLPPPR